MFVLTALAVGSLCAAVPAQTPETWTSVRSKNFAVVGNASPQQLHAAAIRLEQFRWAFSHLYPQLKLDNGKPTHIVVFKDAAAYLEFLPKRPDGSADVDVAGYFQAGEETNYITFAISHGQIDPLSTAVHEYVHSVLDTNFENSHLPPWLSEGLAEYFETVRVGNARNILVGEQQPEHFRHLRRTAIIPLAEFFKVTTDVLKTMTPERRRSYYAEAWAVVQILMNRRAISMNDPAGCLENLGLIDVSDEGASERLAALEFDLNRSIRGLGPAAETVAANEAMPMFDSSAMPLSSAFVSATLGDLLLHTGELVRSEALLRKAIADDAEQSLANASLGLLLLRQDKPADALSFLQKAVKAGSQNHLVLTGYAFATMHSYTKSGAEIPDDAAQLIRSALKRSSEIAPSYTENYRLLALADFVRDENLDDAIALLRQALTIRQDDADLQILLARILLRRADVSQAKRIAEQVLASPPDLKRKAEADEIVKAAFEYSQARSAEPPTLNLSLGERQTLVVLKRSWLTESDVKQIDDERVNNNYNRIIIRPVTGEQQIVGRIEKISCAGSSIGYRVRTGSGISNLTGADFTGVKITVAKEGENTFQIGCGISLDKELAVINYRPELLPTGNRSIGQLTAISFVDADFRLKSIDEMNAARVVAIDDDTLRRSGPSPAVNQKTIRQSISQYLRKVQKGEDRVVGSIDKIECSPVSVTFSVSSGDRKYKFVHPVPGKVELGWYTVASTQLPIACGSGKLPGITVLTFSRDMRSDSVDGELKAIEFVPDDFEP